MFKILARPAFPFSTSEALTVAGGLVPGVGRGAASPHEGRQRPERSGPAASVEPGRVPCAVRSRLVPLGCARPGGGR